MNVERMVIRVVLLVALAIPLGACALEGEPGRPVWNTTLTIDAPARAEPLARGETVPDFSATGLDGRRVAWTDAAGRPAALIVWASWCPHCQRALPLVARVAAEFPMVIVLTVTTSIGRHPGPSPSEFVRAQALPFPVALDDSRNTLAHALGVYRIPVTYWVGPDGRVRDVTEGERGEATLRELFRALAATSR